MVSIKKSRLRLIFGCTILLAHISLIFLSVDLESMTNRNIEDVRLKYRSFQKIPVKVRYYVGKGALLSLLVVPLLGLNSLRSSFLIISIKPNGSGRILFKQRFLKKPNHKDFTDYKGQISYEAPYIYFEPPLKCVDKTQMDKAFVPATWLLEGGRSSVEKFVSQTNRTTTNKI